MSGQRGWRTSRSRAPRGGRSPTASYGRPAPRTNTIRDKAATGGRRGPRCRAAPSRRRDRTTSSPDARADGVVRGGGHRGGRNVQWARSRGGLRGRHRPGPVHRRHRVVKVKSMATQEIGLNEAPKRPARRRRDRPDELIVQLAGDTPSHILVRRATTTAPQIRDIFARRMHRRRRDALTDDPPALAEAARTARAALTVREGRGLRRQLRDRRARQAGGGRAEGNGRMCLTLPETLISVGRVEKLLPTSATSRSSAAVPARRPASG